jgi:hypothetical protein
MATPTGIFYFTWYNEQRWTEARFRYTPLLGRYDSSDPSVVAWQIDLIRYCGIDYVIFELNPEADWGFATLERGIETAIAYLRSQGMRWSFLLDAKSGPVNSPVEQRAEVSKIEKMYRYVLKRRWTDGLVRGPSGRPLLFVFAPLYADALEIADQLGDDVELRMPIFLPEWHWETPVEVSKVIPPRYLDAVRLRLGGTHVRRVRVFDLLVALGYVSFWGESVRNFGGFCSVIPGYDDSLLERAPQLAPRVSRRGGETLDEQFRTAARQRPAHVIVYGWNEYFESTCIEPTRQFGMKYVELLRSLTAELRDGEMGSRRVGEDEPAPHGRKRWSRVFRRFW